MDASFDVHRNVQTPHPLFLCNSNSGKLELDLGWYVVIYLKTNTIRVNMWGVWLDPLPLTAIDPIALFLLMKLTLEEQGTRQRWG